MQPTGDIVYLNHAHTVIIPEVGTPVPLTPLEVDPGPVIYLLQYSIAVTCYVLAATLSPTHGGMEGMVGPFEVRDVTLQ